MMAKGKLHIWKMTGGWIIVRDGEAIAPRWDRWPYCFKFIAIIRSWFL